jgi:uncharacterized coiled-coil protein SlyX
MSDALDSKTTAVDLVSEKMREMTSTLNDYRNKYDQRNQEMAHLSEENDRHCAEKHLDEMRLADLKGRLAYQEKIAELQMKILEVAVAVAERRTP